MRRSDGDNSIPPLPSVAVGITGSKAILENIVPDFHIRNSTRFEPVIDVTFNENGSTRRIEIIIFNYQK